MQLGYAFKFDANKDKILTLVRGVPGSGKSTWAKSMAAFQGGPVHLEADMWHSRNGSYNWIAENVPRAHRWCLETAQVLLQTRGLVVVSNTFTQYKEMYDYLDYAADHKINVNVITMTEEYGNIHNVPEPQLQKMRERFQSHQQIMDFIRADYPL